MKNNVFTAAFVTCILLSMASHARVITFNGLGVGGQLGFVLAEDDGPAFGFGVNGMAEFDLGRFGRLQYAPTLTFWFKSDEWRAPNNDLMEDQDGQVVLNFFDVKYLFPLQRYPINPYIGFSPFPCIVINIDKQWVNKDLEWDRNDAVAGFNIFSGIDFPIKNKFVPYFEWRFMASREWAMRLTGGFVIRF
jgi:hypothetical protein